MSHVARIVAPIAVLSVGAAAAVLLVRAKPEPKRTQPAPLVARVSVEPVTVGPRPVRVSGMGTVVAARQVDLRPEVQGRVVEQHPDLVPGGHLPAGATAVRIDPRDFQARVVEAEAQLQRARFELELEEGRQTVAKREFELLGRDQADMVGNDALALRKPHLANALAAVRAAESGLEVAKLSLARTRLKVPFNALVQDEAVDLGQYVTNQNVVARMVGTDSFWVRVSIPVAALEWVAREEGKSHATVRMDVGQGQVIEKPAHLVRLLGDLDPRGRLARVLVEVEDPLDLELPLAERRPLLLGSFVEVIIEGRDLEDVALIPRIALREGDTVWIMKPDDTLEVRPVEPTWRGPEKVYVRNQLEAGERLITSRIATPVPGMPLQLIGGLQTDVEAMNSPGAR